MNRGKIRSLALRAALAGILAMTAFGGGAVKAQAAEELTGLTAMEITAQMGVGWNLGNTFDATGGQRSNPKSQETSWGNPQVTPELIHAVKEAGFTTIRIPVTWYTYMSPDGTYMIDEAYMNRVKEVVDYAYEEGLFVILNIHHEAWLNNDKLVENCDAIANELATVWEQIADCFADYDQHLIFEGMNEPRLKDTAIEWNGNPEAYQVVNYLNQVFVNTVRNSGKGHNDERCLMIPGYAASSSLAVLESICVPTYQGEAVNNLIISAHCYSPYNFCLSDAMVDFDDASPECVGEIDAVFSNLQALFLNNGIPVVIGETGASAKNNVEAREIWAAYMGKKAAAYGIPIIIWDNGYDGNEGGESHTHMDRYANTEKYPSVTQALLTAAASIPWGSGLDVTQEPDSLFGEAEVIWSDADGRTSVKAWDSTFIALSAQSSYFLDGREIAVVYEGMGIPNLVFNSPAQSVWWIPVNPYKTEDLDGKKVAYFSKEDILTEMENNGVHDFAQLRDMDVMAANSNITAYEVSLIGGEYVITYKANGVVYYMGSDMPQAPAYKDWYFAGWFTTPDYRPGSEYEEGPLTGDITVYAKFVTEPMEEPAEATPDSGEAALETPAGNPRVWIIAGIAVVVAACCIVLGIRKGRKTK